MYHLVTTLAAEAVSESDAYLNCLIEKANMVRTIDRFVRETTSDYNTALRELSSRTQDTRLLRLRAHLGGYAGHMCTLLKGKKQSNSDLLSGKWTKIVKALDAHEDRVTSWNARGRPGPGPTCPKMDAIVVRVQQIVDAGTTDLDTDLTLFAIRAYARRNFIAHGALHETSLSNDSARLAEYIGKDVKLLEEILPDEEKPMVDKWRRLLLIRRNTDIRQVLGEDRKGKDALKVGLGSSPRPTGELGRAFLRCQFEMGLRRGSNSRDGPPPTNVSYDTSLFRCHSKPGKRPISKRPTVRQPSGDSSPKRAGGLDYDSTLEAVPKDIDDKTARRAAELQLELHTLAIELAQRKPGQAMHTFQQKVADLKRQSEKTKAGIERQKRDMEREQRRRKKA